MFYPSFYLRPCKSQSKKAKELYFSFVFGQIDIFFLQFTLLFQCVEAIFTDKNME